MLLGDTIFSPEIFALITVGIKKINFQYIYVEVKGKVNITSEMGGHTGGHTDNQADGWTDHFLRLPQLTDSFSSL